MDNVGQNIADARKRLGLTQEELAARVGYKTKSAINKIELGIRDLPQKKIAAFASALDVTPGYLMGWDDEKKEKPSEYEGLSESVIELIEIAKTLSDEDAAVLLAALKANRKQ